MKLRGCGMSDLGLIAIHCFFEKGVKHIRMNKISVDCNF